MNDIIKVLIVDDEYLVRNLLKKCIDWKSIGMEIVAEASCAEDAFDLVDEYQPDLIFTDICMTDLDGIEFSDIIIKKYPDIKVVVLTGYEDFKYAQRSLQAGIKEYLLKPIDDEVILSTAISMKKKIQEHRNTLFEYDSLKRQFIENIPFFKERLLNRIIQPELDMKLVNRHMEYMNFSFPYGRFQIAIVEIVLQPQFNSIKDEEKINCQEEILDILKEELKCNENIQVFFDMNYRITILINSEEDLLEEIIKSVQSSALDCDCFYYCVGIGGLKAGIENAEKSYLEALEALNYRIILGKNSIIKYDNINFNRDTNENAVLEIDDKLKVYFLAESEKKIQEFIANTFSKRELLINIPMHKIREFVICFTSTIMEVLKELDIDVTELNSKKYNIFDDLFELETIPDIMEYLERISLKAINLISQHKGKKSNKLINDIKEYVKLNLGDAELSLSKVADIFFMNSSYLSRLFKKEMGLNFMEYVIKSRIDKAIMLLRNTDLKAYEIGERVGFPDSSYFSACFKRYTGVSVSEYKKS